ncbi:MAG: hypothetical protein R6X02_09905 [Enhygromyxa sp.]
MTTRPIVLCITFTLTAAVTLIGATSCSQPDINCTSAHGRYAAEYTLVEGDPASACGQLPGDVLGMQTYFQEGGARGTPDYENAKLAIRPESLGTMIAYAEARGVISGDETFYAANALGSFTAGFPDDEGFCMAEQFEPAQVTLPDIPEIPDDLTTPEVDETQRAQPAIAVEYRWSNARFVVTADAQGTQFEADLDYRRDGCTAKYHVVGLYPVVACESDADCDDPRSGINPDFAVRCHGELNLCVLDAELPAYEESR